MAQQHAIRLAIPNLRRFGQFYSLLRRKRVCVESCPPTPVPRAHTLLRMDGEVFGLGRSIIKVVQPTQSIMGKHATRGYTANSAPRRSLAQPKVRAVFVMVGDVLGEQPLQVPLVESNHMVEQLAATAPLWIIKTSRTHEMKDLRPSTARNCDKLSGHDQLPPARDRLDHELFPLPPRSHSRKLGSSSAATSVECETSASPTIDRAQALLDCPAKSLVQLETTARAGYPENRGGVASSGLSPVLETSVASQTGGRPETGEPRGPGLDFPHGW